MIYISILISFLFNGFSVSFSRVNNGWFFRCPEMLHLPFPSLTISGRACNLVSAHFDVPLSRLDSTLYLPLSLFVCLSFFVPIFSCWEARIFFLFFWHVIFLVHFYRFYSGNVACEFSCAGPAGWSSAGRSFAQLNRRTSSKRISELKIQSALLFATPRLVA